jgi:hypothetical protein
MAAKLPFREFKAAEIEAATIENFCDFADSAGNKRMPLSRRGGPERLQHEPTFIFLTIAPAQQGKYEYFSLLKNH